MAPLLARALALLLTLLPTAFAAPLAQAPLAVAAVATEHLALVTWAAGPDADSYRVYGVRADGDEQLVGTATRTERALSVPPGYPTCAVSGVRDGVESPRVRAPFAAGCIRVHVDPPQVLLGCGGLHRMLP